MRRSVFILIASAVIIHGAASVMAVEEAKYSVVIKSGKFEIRDYQSHVVAETVVEAGFEDAGNEAFNRLFKYISGANASRGKIAMTAPVSQEAKGAKIAMTAPVGQQASGGGWAVSFMMPEGSSLETLPVPNDPAVTLRVVPARPMAVVRYSGFWREKSYQARKTQLEAWIKERGYRVAGEAVWARYDPPFTLWFLRRNEVLIPVAAATSPAE